MLATAGPSCVFTNTVVVVVVMFVSLLRDAVWSDDSRESKEQRIRLIVHGHGATWRTRLNVR